MRHGRAKAARRTLQFFRLQYGIRPPYHVLLDGTFLLQVIQQKVPLKERLDRTLQHQKCILYVTRSSLKELQALSEQPKVNEKLKERLVQARQWGLDECDVILEDKDIVKQNEADKEDGCATTSLDESSSLGVAGQDIWNLVSSSSSNNDKSQRRHTGNHPQHCLVATQDETLLDALRHLGTVPLLRLSRGVLLLEHPSKASQKNASTQEHKKWAAGVVKNPKEQALVQHVKDLERRKRKEEAVKQQQTAQRRVKPKAKEPNPLSCKKKRSDDAEGSKPKRKRRRKHGKTQSSEEVSASA